MKTGPAMIGLRKTGYGKQDIIVIRAQELSRAFLKDNI
jgi:hypothetical protein